MVLCLTIRRLNAIFLFQDYVFDELVTQFLSSSIIPPDTQNCGCGWHGLVEEDASSPVTLSWDCHAV